jgi:signal transduction histidine kinase/CheY-like chemotaxis protein
LAIFHFRAKNRIKKYEDENKSLSQSKKHFEAILSARNYELKSALRKLEDGKQLSSMFLNNLTHEVRTPLNVILGFSKLLYDENLSLEVRQNYLDIINKKGYNLLHLINDILTTSQIDSGELEINRTSCNINKLLSDLYKSLSNDERAKKNAALSINFVQSQSDSRSIVITDPIRLEQVLWNLLDNALKFTEMGSIEFGYRIDGTQIVFFVTDTGIGIEKENIDKVFERFCKIVANNNPTLYSGTGLGLSIAKELVGLLDGKVWVESEPGKGTSFYLTIPYIPVKSNFTGHFSKSFLANNSLNLKGKIILVVEDDFISYQLIETLLEKSEAKLIHVKNGEDAVEVAKLTANLDLILMDMQLPFLSGYEASAQIKAIMPHVPIVAQTAHAMNDDKVRCLEAGCDGYIPKPIDPDEFMLTIGRFLLGEPIVKS